MTTEVDNYRGFEIRFDTDNETFECDIDDSRSIKKSYSSIKTFIDEYIKENHAFKPFKVMSAPLSSYGGKDGTIIGIRKDKRFMIELPNGTKEQVSAYHLKDHWIVTDAIVNKLKEIEPILSEIKQIEKKRQDLYDQRNNFYTSIKATTLKEYKDYNHS